MNLLMVSGDRQVAVGERGPFHSMQRAFSRYFDRIDVLCPRPPGPVNTRVIHDNVWFHPARTGRLGMIGYIEARGLELLEQHSAKLIVSHDYGWFYNGLGSARLTRATGVPYVSEIHHVPGVPIAGDLRERFDRFIARCYVGWARRKARAFRVVNSEEMPNLLRRWRVPEEKILVLPSIYIDADVFHARAERPAPEYDVVYVGRMVANKGVDRILDALAILTSKGRAMSALFVGKGPLLEAMRERAARSGVRARFLEWVDDPSDLAELYSRSRVCICASTCEGGPRFTVEAMACGTPVVSTPVGVMGELLSDGRAGSLTGFDPERIAAALESVLQDEKQRAGLGAHAAKLACSFEYERVLENYANGLRTLVGEPPLHLVPRDGEGS